MNPQMQGYRPYPGQGGRRPGMCAPSTFYLGIPGISGYQAPMYQDPVYLHPVHQYTGYQNMRYHHAGYPIPSLQYIGPMQQGQVAQQQAQMMAIQQQQQARQRELVEHQSAARRSRKPNTREMPDNVEEWIIGGGVQQYKSLREVEKKLDHTMQRKRLDIQDSVNRAVKRQKTMRLWISNTAKNQPWQGGNLDDNGFDFGNAGEGTWRVKVEGRLLDDESDAGEPDQDSDDEDENEDEEMRDNDGSEKTTATKIPVQKFSHFFKAVSVEFDRSKNVAADPTAQVDWKKPANAEFDSVEFERKGDESMNVTINLVRDEQPERFRLSAALARTLDLEEADRAEVVMGLWDYVKANGLQEDEERRNVRCDQALKLVFNRDVVPFPAVPDLIMDQLHPLPPIKLNYTIRVDADYVNDPTPTIYDVRVTTDDPLKAKVVALIQNPGYHNSLRQIAQLDDSLAVLVQAIQHSKAKHTFYKSMQKDPANFIKRWMSSQRRDLEVILGEASRGGGEDGSGPEFARGGKDGVWDTQVVKEAVRYMLAKPQAAR